MSLKPNSWRVLIGLFSQPESGFSFSSQHLQWLLPDLTMSGRRSLLRHLSQQGYVLSQSWPESGGRLSLTNRGRELVTAQFPALRSGDQAWSGEWSLVVFLQPPTGDRQFRYLRQILSEYHAVSVSRGVYLVSEPLNPRISDLLRASYWQSVVVWRLNQWQIGDERQLVEQWVGLTDAISAYSGVSTELTELLRRWPQFMSLTDQQKQRAFSVFDRLISLIQKDNGVLQHYAPQVTGVVELLAQWQQLVAIDTVKT